MKHCITLLVSFCLLFAGCVGTDFIDDPLVEEKISVDEQTLALMPNEAAQLTAVYYNVYGIRENVTLEWLSSDPTVATVANGLVTAKKMGQTLIQPAFKNFLGPQVQVTVVSDPTAVATVEVPAPSKTLLQQSEEIQLQAIVKNIEGEVLPGITIEWFSENSQILSVTATGQVTAVGSGIAGVHAKANGVKSNSINFTVAGTARTGTFVAAGGYKTSGTARLEVINNDLILTLSDNFDTDFALGTFIYLANSTNGGTVRSQGFEVAQIFTDGGKTFNITQLNPSIKLSDYRYVIVLCKPASVTFGFADLN